VTHDQVEAMTLGQRIVVFNAGRIEQVGTPHELYNHPGNLFVAGFLGSPKMNVIPAEVAAATAQRVGVRLPGGAALDVAADGSALRPGDRLTLGVRAEHIGLRDGADSEANLVDAAIGHVEYLGDMALVHATLAGAPGMIAVKQPAEAAALPAGSRARLHLPAQRCLLFDAAGKALPRAAAAA
jgi:multiple sugar transport system ATP-binding protein